MSIKSIEAIVTTPVNSVNRIIRRFVPKGCDMGEYTLEALRKIETWINRYPRKILNFKTAEEPFAQELVA